MCRLGGVRAESLVFICVSVSAYLFKPATLRKRKMEGFSRKSVRVI